MLFQEPDLDDELTVFEQIMRSNAPQIQLYRRYESTSLELQAEPNNQESQRRMARLAAELDRTGGWSAMARAKSVLTQLGISEFDTRIAALSGGQRKRVALAQSLIAPADLLILDEPTNHVDADTVAWMESYLLGRPGALLMVTHDRYFLERVANRIVQLDRRQLINYPGNYASFLEKSSKRREQLNAAERKKQNLIRQELDWLNRGAMARGTKQKARKQRIAQLQQLDPDQGNRRIAIALASRRLGKKVLEATDLGMRYGNNLLFSGLDFRLDPGDRVGLIGPNGVGKSTLLDILAGRVLPETGQVTWGTTVRLAYYDQQSAGLREEKEVLAFIEERAALIRTPTGSRIDAAQVLDWFLFPREEQTNKISSLSGGERRRLYLLYCLMGQPNVLFLDEPTNDLDIQTLNVLEQFLDHFGGSLVVVSHDRFFLDRNVDYLLSFEEGSLGKRYPTPYESFRKLTAAGQMPEIRPSSRRRGRHDGPALRKLTWSERRELEDIEEKMERLEGQIQALETTINRSGHEYERLGPLAKELEELRESLATMEERWLELSEIEEAGG
jgi:ATP-binding cassette subfamily F protein uup